MAAVVDGDVWRSQAGIPIRSLWALLVYAHDLAEFVDRFDAEAEDAADLPELLAKLLSLVVERRLRRNLSRAYRPREAVLDRVRGRIEWLPTETGRLLERGVVACRFEDLTSDTPRNRLVRAALEACAGGVDDAALAHVCRTLARDLDRLGVSAGRPSRSELARDQIARHDAEDRLMVAVASLALDLVLPGERSGQTRATRLERDEALLARIFERAVAGFYRHSLHGRDRWRVQAQSPFDWTVEAPTAEFSGLLPGMRTDLVLERDDRRLVIDTKFTGVLTRNQYGAERFKNAHLYQMYAYLRSQEGRGGAAERAGGLLLHPALDQELDESATIQGHVIRFATIDLAAPPKIWTGQLLRLALTSSVQNR